MKQRKVIKAKVKSACLLLLQTNVKLLKSQTPRRAGTRVSLFYYHSGANFSLFGKVKLLSWEGNAGSSTKSQKINGCNVFTLESIPSSCVEMCGFRLTEMQTGLLQALKLLCVKNENCVPGDIKLDFFVTNQITLDFFYSDHRLEMSNYSSCFHPSNLLILMFWLLINLNDSSNKIFVFSFSLY